MLQDYDNQLEKPHKKATFQWLCDYFFSGLISDYARRLRGHDHALTLLG